MKKLYFLGIKLKKAWREIRYSHSSPFYFCSVIANTNAKVLKIHSLASKNTYPTFSLTLVYSVKIMQFILWPFRLVELSIKMSSKAGKDVAFQCEKSRIKQIIEILYLSFKYSLPPQAYYNYQLYFSHKQPLMSEYIYSHEAAALFNLLNLNTKDNLINNKLEFSDFCIKHNLPCVETIAEVKAGSIYFSSKYLQDFQSQGVFIKPVIGSKGENCEAWISPRKGVYLNQYSQQLFNQEDFLSYLKKLSLKTPLLIQPLLKSHPEISDISFDTISCLRIVTAVKNNKIIHIRSVLKVPFAHSATNTLGLICPINNQTARLDRSYRYKLFCPGYDVHPENNAPIKGRLVPDYHEALGLALLAHKLFDGVAFLGWDIALTDKGPVILETNKNWDVLTMQRGEQGPLLSSADFLSVCEGILHKSSKF